KFAESRLGTCELGTQTEVRFGDQSQFLFTNPGGAWAGPEDHHPDGLRAPAGEPSCLSSRLPHHRPGKFSCETFARVCSASWQGPAISRNKGRRLPCRLSARPVVWCAVVRAWRQPG